VPPTGDTFNPMVIVLVLASVAALAVLALNRKKFI
jgi:LPXTG-motif cell wall-anchored protein